MKLAIFILFILIFFSEDSGALITYKIGVVCPISNSSKTFGIGHLQGVTLAVDQFNKDNLEANVEIEIVDDHSSPSYAISKISAFNQGDAVAVLGPCNSSVAEYVVRDASLKIPVISSLTTNTKLINISKNPYFFRANVPDSKRMESMLEKIFSGEFKRPKKITIFFERDDSYGEGLKADVINWLSKRQEKYLKNYVSFVGYSRDEKVDQIKLFIDDQISQGYLRSSDAVLMLGIAADARRIIREIRKKDENIQLYFSEPNHPEFQSLVSEGINIGGLRVLSVWDPENKYIESFKKEFYDRYAEDPSFAASLAYDATNILLWAIERQNSQSLKNIQQFRDGIKDTLLQFGPASNIETTLSGNLSLAGHEYSKLKFAGLQYFSDGTINGWNDEPKGVYINVTKQSLTLELPKFLHILTLISFGCLGGFLREFQHAKKGKYKVSIVSLLRWEIFIDGLISLITASFLLILVLVTQPSFLTSGADISSVYYFSSVAIGALSGFLGVRSIHALLKRFNIDVAEKQEQVNAPSKEIVLQAQK